MCSPRNTGNIYFSLWLTDGLSQGCPDFQKVYVFKVYVPFSCPEYDSTTGVPDNGKEWRKFHGFDKQAPQVFFLFVIIEDERDQAKPRFPSSRAKTSNKQNRSKMEFQDSQEN